MSNSLLQLLVLAAVAVFLIVRLRNVLGTRDGFEPTQTPAERVGPTTGEVVDLRPDPAENDIADHAEPGSPTSDALHAMKRVEPDFEVTPFLQGAKSAYEMILMGFERGDISEIRDFLAPEVAQAFDQVIESRNERGLVTEADYIGTRETALAGASFDDETGLAEITVRFVGEFTLAVRDAQGEIVEGDPKTARKQRDTWTFARQMGQDDPNWRLVATA